MTQQEAEILEELRLRLEGDFFEGAAEFNAKLEELAGRIQNTGTFAVLDDPFKGRDRELAEDPDYSLVVYWRMFDRTPLAMVPDFGIKFRRILAQRLFRHCGEGTVIHHGVLFNSGKNLWVGDDVTIARDVMLDDRDSITLERGAGLAAGAMLLTHTHVLDDFTKPFVRGGRLLEPVTLGPDSFVGYNSIVQAGVSLGERAFVAANSVVTKDVPPRTIVGGVPAKIIREIVPRHPSSVQRDLR